MRKRAIRPEEKSHRRQMIIDAAQALWLAHPDRVMSVAEVAEAAGVAKGTVYLYFESKEALLLALHEQALDGFFDAMTARCTAGPTEIDDLLELTRIHLAEAPGFLPLASLVLGLTERQITPALVTAFHQRSARRLERAGAALLPHFALGGVNEAAALLNASYALITGLWQLRRSVEGVPELSSEPALGAVTGDYYTALADALLSLWQGHLSRRGEFQHPS